MVLFMNKFSDMEEIIKHINDTNASYRSINAGDAKNTDLFLDNEHYELFKDSGEQITVRFFKENLMQSVLFISSILPRKYDNSSIHEIINFSKSFVFDQLALLDALFKENGNDVNSITQIWNARKDVPQKNGKIDSRFYFNGLLKDVEYVDSLGKKRKTKFTIRNYFAGGYSEFHIKKAIDGVFEVRIENTTTPYDDGKEDDRFEEVSNSKLNIYPLQVIYYGAPGTGKSHKIEEYTNDANRIRTTFHPDSDYSTFVGAYKPTMEVHEEKLYTKGELISKLTELKEHGVTYSPQKFGAKYWFSLKQLNIADKKEILMACGMSDNYTVEFEKGIAVGEEYLAKSNDSRIVYKYVPQAFLKAYVNAWKLINKGETLPYYLIIEEINRGNCAQIVGDLFQLLDRGDNGESKYTISPDDDIKRFLAEEFKESVNLPIKIKNGEEMRLPANLYIWATMNTSDQSLFPIDSAFKRRWDWEYMPIEKGNKDFVIEIGDSKYDWWNFIETINGKIDEITGSEDKKLGYWFAKPAGDNIVISCNQFVSKVLFYLWNDVYKDYTDDNRSIFRINDGISTKKVAFTEFFGSQREFKLHAFMKANGIFPISGTEFQDDITEDTNTDVDGSVIHKKLVSITIDGEKMTLEGKTHFRLYLEALKKIGIDKVGSIIEGSKYKRQSCPLASKEQYDAISSSSKYEYIKQGDYYFVKGASDDTLINVLELIKSSLQINMFVEYVK